MPVAFAARIKRAGIVKAMGIESFAAAVNGRNKPMIAEVTNDVGVPMRCRPREKSGSTDLIRSALLLRLEAQIG